MSDSPIFDTTNAPDPAQPAEQFPVEIPAPADPAPVDGPLAVAVPEVVAPPGGKVITLPSGHKVAVRGTRAIRNRDRERLFSGIDYQSEDRAAAGFHILANILSLLIVGWDVKDYDDATGEPVGDVLPIPSATTEDVLGSLSLEDGSALDDEASEVQKLLMPNFEPNPDQSSPTQPSAG